MKLVKVRTFSGAEVNCMVDQVKKAIRDDKPNIICKDKWVKAFKNESSKIF